MARLIRRASRLGLTEVPYVLEVRVEALVLDTNEDIFRTMSFSLTRGSKADYTKPRLVVSHHSRWGDRIRRPVTFFRDESTGQWQEKEYKLELRQSVSPTVKFSLASFTIDATQYARDASDGERATHFQKVDLYAPQLKGIDGTATVRLYVRCAAADVIEPTEPQDADTSGSNAPPTKHASSPVSTDTSATSQSPNTQSLRSLSGSALSLNGGGGAAGPGRSSMGSGRGGGGGGSTGGDIGLRPPESLPLGVGGSGNSGEPEDFDATSHYTPLQQQQGPRAGGVGNYHRTLGRSGSTDTLLRSTPPPTSAAAMAAAMAAMATVAAGGISVNSHHSMSGGGRSAGAAGADGGAGAALGGSSSGRPPVMAVLSPPVRSAPARTNSSRAWTAEEVDGEGDDIEAAADAAAAAAESLHHHHHQRRGSTGESERLVDRRRMVEHEDRVAALELQLERADAEKRSFQVKLVEALEVGAEERERAEFLTRRVAAVEQENDNLRERAARGGEAAAAAAGAAAAAADAAAQQEVARLAGELEEAATLLEVCAEKVADVEAALERWHGELSDACYRELKGFLSLVLLEIP